MPRRRHPSRRRKRWLVFLASLIGVLVLAAAGISYLWLPHYRPALRPGESYGIDVSNHQGRIDWRRVAGDHISFAYIKATEGSDFVDRWFAVNWKAAREAGLARGAYHFFSLCSPGLDQARNYLSTVPDDPTALAPAVDLELSGNCSRRPSRTTIDDQLGAFLQAVESRTGRSVVVYLGHDFASYYPGTVAMRRPLWLPRFLRRPSSDRWLIWQVGGYAHVSGVSGKVDLDIMRNTRPGPGRTSLGRRIIRSGDVLAGPTQPWDGSPAWICRSCSAIASDSGEALRLG